VESRVEQFEQFRRDRDREGLSIRGLAARHGVHRRAVREALLWPVPPAKRSPVGRSAPKLGPCRAVIDGWLEADREAPRKQRHTAKRIWQRLVDEHDADVAERTVRQYVRARKRAMGWPVAEVFVPQVHAPGMEAGVDWGEAEVVLAGVATTVHLFVMGASFSGAAFCQASLVETQQAFLELHVQAFAWFGGVFPSLRFDNLKSAVKKVLKGRRRVESDRFVALRSHYLFASQFTTPGLEGAHEKGGVEGEVGRHRRKPLGAGRARCGPRRAERAAARRLRSGFRPADRRTAGECPGGVGCGAAVAARFAGRAVRCVRGGSAEGGCEVVGHDPSEPLLGAGLSSPG
jgi:transposase